MASSPTSDPGKSPGHHASGGNGAVPSWWIYRGTGRPATYATNLAERLPGPPPWRRFDGGPDQPDPPTDDEETARVLGVTTALAGQPLTDHETAVVEAVNTALLLRRPLLVTGAPGVGKSSLAYHVSRELGLGRVLRWPITSRSTLRSGLYEYDPIARIHDISADAAAAPDDQPPPERPIGDYLSLGPLGTALLPHRLPRVLVIDEFDKGDIDLANDLLDVLEYGRYRIPELVRLRSSQEYITVPTDDPGRTATVHEGEVRCHEFPFIVITSNGERPLPPAFLRRCLPVHLERPSEGRLADIVCAHFIDRERAQDRQLIQDFLRRSQEVNGLSIDQLLNSVHLVSSDVRAHATSLDPNAWNRILNLVWRRLTETEAGLE
ncbi:MoxR family ATPase [Nocardiopsis gilva YIM 90087]|uniref:MoxR family ATPase n=1 Tax=Nocardiopsis gilva YIM 90087 TaxID=1235441 RepID=A0A223S5P4_9ACTN|nr:MoxR family ATPase [Nocardiopsis gilva]ASU83448.1 MoxR family ATPase [Nocardiopsis gilva YIM 90087]